MSADPRAAAALRVLAEAGFPAATCAPAGHDRSIAAIGNVALDRAAEIAALAPAIRAAGFRYVTLDLGSAPS